MDAKTLVRFWGKVDKAGPLSSHCPELGPCWLWTASCSDSNKPREQRYGQFHIDGKVERAHRASYLIAHGAYPEDGLLVLHYCHNPQCVNPAHLHSGTDADNSVEKAAAGRRNDAIGENQGGAKLTEAKVLSIRAMHAAGNSQIALGQMHGVTQTTVSLIVRRKTWTHI